MTGVEVHDHGCMLRAYHREIVRQVVLCVEHSPYVPTLANGLARRAIEIEVGHAKRTSGRSNYTFQGLVHLLYDMLTSFSFLPLRFLSAIGLLISIGAAVAATALVLRGLFGGFGSDASGLLTAFLFFLVGLLFSALGLVGEYVGRIHAEVRKRPRFVVRRQYDVPAEAAPGVDLRSTEVEVPLVAARDDDLQA
jgi:undecaprenyl-phosphate 4-deoxy-4-formamido-L-arabinose transferase